MEYDDRELRRYWVAWRTMVDWVEAQMALVELELVRLEAVFLPSIVDPGGQTFFEALEQRHFQLGAGDAAPAEDER